MMPAVRPPPATIISHSTGVCRACRSVQPPASVSDDNGAPRRPWTEGAAASPSGSCAHVFGPLTHEEQRNQHGRHGQHGDQPPARLPVPTGAGDRPVQQRRCDEAAATAGRHQQRHGQRAPLRTNQKAALVCAASTPPVIEPAPISTPKTSAADQAECTTVPMSKAPLPTRALPSASVARMPTRFTHIATSGPGKPDISVKTENTRPSDWRLNLQFDRHGRIEHRGAEHGEGHVDAEDDPQRWQQRPAVEVAPPHVRNSRELVEPEGGARMGARPSGKLGTGSRLRTFDARSRTPRAGAQWPSARCLRTARRRTSRCSRSCRSRCLRRL